MYEKVFSFVSSFTKMGINLSILNLFTYYVINI